MSWEKIAEELRFDRHYSWTALAYEMQRYFPGLTEKQVLEKVRRKLRRSERYEGKKPEKKPEKVEVIENKEPAIIVNEWNGNRIIRFGLCGDMQTGSRYTQITHLHDFYDICERDGIDTVYNTGDLTDGMKMRPGHEYELYTITADEMVEDFCKVYPKRKGIKTKAITGNHDAAIFKACGYDIGNTIASIREDFEYLGRDCAIVNLTPNCTLELRHPWDGTAYALSYKIQKMIEAMEADSKPNILAVGHYHKAEQLFHRNVHAFQTGCFQGQTPFTRGKGISISMGGWIVEVEVDKKGTIERLKSEFIPYYKAIHEDYKNWR